MLPPFLHALPHSSGYSACRQDGTPLEFSEKYPAWSCCESQHAGSRRHASCTWTARRGKLQCKQQEVLLSSLFGHSDPVRACSSQGDSEIRCDFVLLCDVVTACTESGHAVPALLDEAWWQAITCCKWKVKCPAYPCMPSPGSGLLPRKKCARYCWYT